MKDMNSGDGEVRGQLTLALSERLIDRLKHSAADEGISLEQLAAELLTEGVTLRAWEIIERKSAMRGPDSQPGFSGNYQPRGGGNRRGPGNQGNHGNHGNQGGGPGRRPQSNAWMEDKAAFLEYVRNQEKQRR